MVETFEYEFSVFQPENSSTVVNANLYTYTYMYIALDKMFVRHCRVHISIQFVSSILFRNFHLLLVPAPITDFQSITKVVEANHHRDNSSVWLNHFVTAEFCKKLFKNQSLRQHHGRY